MAKSVKKNVSVAAKKTQPETVKKISVKSRRIAKDTSNVNPEFTDQFIKEIDEDVKNDQLKVLWNKYGLFVIAFVVLAVSAAVSFEKIKDWKQAQNQARTQNYIASTQLETPEQTIEALQKINTANQGIFSDFAKLQIANVLFNQKKNEEALATLQSLIDDKQVNDEVKNIALIKLATYKVDTMPRAEFEAMLKPLTDEKSSWRPLAYDLIAMSAVHDGDIDTAKRIYENVLQLKDLPEGFRVKVQDMLSSLGDM